MKKSVIAILLGMLLIGTLGAVVVGAGASDNIRTNYGNGFGHRHGCGTRYMDPGYCAGNFSSCPYLNSNETVELKIKTIDEAFEIARAEVDDDISKEDIYQRGRWWIIPYEDNNGVSNQARIDAVTGEVFTFTTYSIPPEPQGRGMCGRGQGFCRANGY